MHKNILIPTDFQMESLNTIKRVIYDLKEEDTATITLLHGYYLTDSITDLLFNSKRDILNQIVPSAFFEGCDLLKNKYDSQLENVKIDLFHGLNKRAFKTYVSSKQIDNVYVPVGFSPKKVSKNSFDLVPYIQKCCENVSHVEFEERQEENVESFSELFLNTVKV